MNSAALFAVNMTVQRAGGYIVLALMVAGALGWVIFTVSTGRRGAGSEVELAANRKQYLSDEELETTKLDRSLLAAVGLFFLISLARSFRLPASIRFQSCRAPALRFSCNTRRRSSPAS